MFFAAERRFTTIGLVSFVWSYLKREIQSFPVSSTDRLNETSRELYSLSTLRIYTEPFAHTPCARIWSYLELLSWHYNFFFWLIIALMYAFLYFLVSSQCNMHLYSCCLDYHPQQKSYVCYLCIVCTLLLGERKSNLLWLKLNQQFVVSQILIWLAISITVRSRPALF